MSEIQNLMNDLRAGRINRREFIGQSLAMGVSLSGIAMLLQSCGGGGGSAANPPIKWSTWGNAGEIQRFQEFTKKYNTDHKANVTLIPVPSSVNYVQKILTELNGGVAPDLFYAGDGDIIKFVQNKTIVELTALLGSSKSHSKVDEYLPGLWGASKTKSGKIYGVPVDCNPLVLWYNKKVLQDAGVTDDPATLASQGQWTRDKFEEIINKVHAKGKYGYVLDDWTLPVYSWITPQGGTVYDEDGYGQFVAQDDAKAVEAFQWLAKGMQSKTLTFAGTLPKGTGADLAFISNQVAFVSAGRWYLPEFKVAKGLEYDIVPFPSSTGKMEPAGVALAYMVINNKTKYQDAAFEFLTNFVSKEGQTFRLQGGGNAVPSIKGPDQLVLEGNLPAHAQTFLDARNAGYALFPAEMGTPGLSDDIKTTFQNIWLKNADVKDTLGKISAMANPRIK
ncbi:MAG: sugar ABC transporter substrate-binding protein, partial [Ktedonobacteraceae bacterium]|nr:sugar ABC transporter substrate-binding protein [Ktedonobacteraceae bacterium]